MEDFNEKYERVEVDGVTKFRYRKPSLVPDWLRTWAGEDPYANMTPAQINKIRREQGKQPYSRSEFETFGLDPAGPRRVPLKGYDEPASSGLSPAEVKKLQQAANDARKAGRMSDIRGSETPGSSVPAPAKPYKPETTTTLEPSQSQSQPQPQPPKPSGPSLRDTAAELRAMRMRSIERQGGRADEVSKLKSTLSPAQASASDVTKAELEKIRQQSKAATMKKEAYDVVLDYLLSEGHADTVEEAHYVMMQLDAEYIQSIVEQQDTILPAEAAFNKSTPEERAAYKKKYGTPYPPPDTSRRAGGGSNQAPAWMRGGFQSPAEYNKLDPETKALLEY